MNLSRIQEVVSLEPAYVLVGLSAISWIIYKVALGAVSLERHKMLGRLFKNLLFHLLAGSSFLGIYLGLTRLSEDYPSAERFLAYAGTLAIIWAAIIFIKAARIFLFEYLFLGHMRSGVPLLLVNLLTLILSLVLSGWILTEIFYVKLTPLLATSAIFSLVLGLALQDTLGNLFAGVALQIDKPYEIGDWIEVQNGAQKWVGQVYEISWRATILLGFGDEFITVSNRSMAQSEIINFAAKSRPFLRIQLFRIPYGSPIAKAKEILTYTALATPGVRKDPLPDTIVSELNENWILLKLFYYIDNYPIQYMIADKINLNALEGLEKAGMKIAQTRITVGQLER